MNRALLLPCLVACSSANGAAPTDAGGDALTDASAQSTTRGDACLPFGDDGDAGDVCLGNDPEVILFPAPSDALTTTCRAFVSAEARGAVSTAAGSLQPTITVPANGDVVSAEHWIMFAWTQGKGTSNTDTFVVDFRQGCTPIGRVFVQGSGWPVDPPTWARMKAVTGAIEMTVSWAGDSPVAGAPVSFTMGP
jgi:hypothetical protein